ncbi:endonuclease/exonuclease/phosphatase family protein [Marinifilum caeruleilacunae]|uniref:Endonuclease/exonuclease/phosphatase family protein n=1 Tax=Marinifilum caeruleilacunae TaxID=2499076 RepID=A0ABX1X158_9BACT|nr:endonuclease/exonuclease/phosphatase family protein [Marinifilum caeruleilacunae]NOU62145.1 endonuclease/exonuclease/phosphatase family protein [Marinifilum caeruleilacunae]
MKILKKYYLILLSVISAACDPFSTKIGSEVALYQSAEIKECSFPDTLKVMTWNIKFGGGRIDFFFDCHGDRVIMEKSEVMDHMSSLVEKIREVNPDILLIQEADVNAKRSAFVDQVQYLLDNTDLNYAAYASQWKASTVPSDGIGKMDSGNAILSKWNFTDAKRIALPLIQSQNFIVRYFYLKRNILDVQLEHEGKKLHVLNTHASAYAKDDTKKKQLDIIKAYADAISLKGDKVILGGDFNSLPPYTQQTSSFDDSVCTDEEFEADNYSAETQWMMPFYENYQAAIPLDEYQNNNKDHFTHTTDKSGFWNRKLDYLFTNGKFIHGSGKTLQQWMQISDHAPIMVNYEL